MCNARGGTIPQESIPAYPFHGSVTAGYATARKTDRYVKSGFRLRTKGPDVFLSWHIYDCEIRGSYTPLTGFSLDSATVDSATVDETSMILLAVTLSTLNFGLPVFLLTGKVVYV